MPNIYVNVEVATLYEEPRYKSAVDSQLLLWQRVELLETETQFSKVRAEDGHIGWVSKRQLCAVENFSEKTKMVTCGHSAIYSKPSSNSPQIRSVSASSLLPIIEQHDDWIKTVTPDQLIGWIPASCFSEIQLPTRQAIIQHAYKFLGSPYQWGGGSIHGIDCSGYTQLLHKLVGISTRRDSPMQFDDAKFVSNDIDGGQIGDLLFFAESSERITHVALIIDTSRYIHACGMVKTNSILQSHYDFDSDMAENFVAIKTFLN